ncbi:MAG: hypothetical protein KDB28_00945 [Tetrasphaera sp.]|nr:hypothetical protein [Tetrasphaera sp.]
MPGAGVADPTGPDHPAYGEHLAARFRESARALERAFAARDHPEAQDLDNRQTADAIEVRWRLAELLDMADVGEEFDP